MNRRDFLKMFGAGLALAAAPKFIFDMGANLYKTEGLYYRDRLFYSGDPASTYFIKWQWITDEDLKGFYYTERTINPVDQGIFLNLTV